MASKNLACERASIYASENESSSFCPIVTTERNQCNFSLETEYKELMQQHGTALEHLKQLEAKDK